MLFLERMLKKRWAAAVMKVVTLIKRIVTVDKRSDFWCAGKHPTLCYCCVRLRWALKYGFKNLPSVVVVSMREKGFFKVGSGERWGRIKIG